MMNEIIFMVEDSPDGGYTAEALGQSIFTEADTVPELKANILDAMKCHYDSNVPKIIRLHFVKEEVLQYA
ncbi:MAG: hypothetical protein WCS96_00265 [Victivallales bacterium]